ncbi:MAG TPA: S8 family serine peptidase [Solirubrobacteraceae bacterium]|nr:S8 family serine peptidase [Solirubrobacteraceae bacterium]
MSLTRKGGAAAVAAGLVMATTGASVAAGSTAGPNVSSPSFARLSATQVKARASGKREPMVVVFDNQLTNLPANAAERHARAAAATSMQAPLLAQLRQVRATHLKQLWLLNAVAATMPAAEAQALANTPGVKAVVPDGTIIVGGGDTPATNLAPASQLGASTIPAAAADGQQMCNASGGTPLVEPEALTSIDATQASAIATGQGVIIGNVDANSLAGNLNMIRPDGQHVIIDAPNPNENKFNDEFNGDVSTMAAQGTVTYTYASQLPYSDVPAGCSFRIEGDATGASILSTGGFTDTNSFGQTVAPESQVIAGLQQAVNEGVNVVSESYGFGALPGANDDLIEPTNVAMVQAGVVVVESAGDSGSSGTVEEPAANPDIIDACATTDLRLLAQAYGYTNGWLDDNMATLSSGGTTPQNDVVDLCAPGYASLAVAGIHKQPAPALPTEAFGGTSESAPFISGAAADVIQAYRDSHGGATPTPAQVKEILTSTATDIGAPSDQQGAGLLNIDAAVQAAQQMPGTSVTSSTTPELVDNPTQLDVQGTGGSTVPTSVTLYNASSSAETVTGNYRTLGGETPFGAPVTENVSAPPPPFPTQGATAATPIHFTVPSGVSVLDADMRWTDPTNSDDNILAFILTDPAGRLAQESYDYGAANYVPCAGGGGCSPDIQHATVDHPMAGTWTAQILWANGRGHAQSPPDTPGPYTGTVTFQAGGQNFTTSPASAPVTIPARSSVVVPLSIAMPSAPGDAPESVQFTGADGLESSVPIARRTLIPSSGGSFDATLTSSVSRGAGQIKTFYVNVPPGENDLDVSFQAPDHAADDPVYYYLFSPADLASPAVTSFQFGFTATDTTPTPLNPTGNASLITPDPQAGLWEIDVMQGATTDGTVFSQTVTGVVAYNQLGPVTETGLPTSKKTIVDSGSSVPITVQVTNTTNHVGYFELQPSGHDITGGSTVTPVKLGPGITGTLTATLSAKAKVGSVVSHTLSVIDSTDWGATEPAVGFPASFSDFHDFAYSYKVGR